MLVEGQAATRAEAVNSLIDRMAADTFLGLHNALLILYGALDAVDVEKCIIHASAGKMDIYRSHF